MLGVRGEQGSEGLEAGSGSPLSPRPGRERPEPGSGGPRCQVTSECAVGELWEGEMPEFRGRGLCIQVLGLGG